MRLWLVRIHEDDFEYGYFVSAVVWAKTEKAAKAMIMTAAEDRDVDGERIDLPRPGGSRVRLTVSEIPVPAAAPNILHVHWLAD